MGFFGGAGGGASWAASGSARALARTKSCVWKMNPRVMESDDTESLSDFQRESGKVSPSAKSLHFCSK
jgi:hypothetical protein